MKELIKKFCDTNSLSIDEFISIIVDYYDKVNHEQVDPKYLQIIPQIYQMIDIEMVVGRLAKCYNLQIVLIHNAPDKQGNIKFLRRYYYDIPDKITE